SVSLGLFTVAVMPRPTANPFANCVLPAPSGPISAIRSPAVATVARCAANERVSAADRVSTSTSLRGAPSASLELMLGRLPNALQIGERHDAASHSPAAR